MRSTLPTVAALVAALLVGEALAGPHQRHQQFHKKRDEVIVTDDEWTTVTVTNVVTVQWPPEPTTPAAPPATTPVAATTKPAKAAVLLQEPSSSVSIPPKPTSSSPAAAAASPLLNLDVNIGGASVKPTTLATFVKPSTAAAPSTTSQAAVSSAVSPPPSSGGFQVGVPYNDASLLGAFTGSGSKVSWCYNWGNAPSGSTAGLEFVAMLWGGASQFTSSWSSAASSALAAGATHLLGFNEPDLPAQANMSPQEAATAWKQYMQPFAGKAQLVSPAVTNGQAPMGTGWMQSFLSACSDCTIDICAYHFYDSATNIEYFKSYVQDAYKACGGSRHIWFTELGVTGTDEQISQWMQQATSFMQSTGYVDRVAYFMAAQGNMNSGSGLSAIGQTWASL